LLFISSNRIVEFGLARVTQSLQITPQVDMRNSTRKIWACTFADAELLDLAGPWSVFGQANSVLNRTAYELTLVSTAKSKVRTRHGLTLSEAQLLADLRGVELPHTFIVAGGSRELPLTNDENSLCDWLRKTHARINRVVSVCSGALLLAHAGLLDGREATTHWKFLSEMQRRYPKVRVQHEGIYVRDGKFWTSAGVTAGIDLALALVEEDHGHRTAMAVAKNLLLYLRRPGHQAQFSDPLQLQEQETHKLRDVVSTIQGRLGDELSVESLAESLDVSPRTLTRACREELGESPAALIRRVRLAEAKRLLSETTLPLKTISVRVGGGDPSTLWRMFTKHLGVTPTEYRARFSSVRVTT
jgi:transcriptional regulator GlxA family with amidase domain